VETKTQGRGLGPEAKITLFRRYKQEIDKLRMDIVSQRLPILEFQ
jgi:hypothetical protein